MHLNVERVIFLMMGDERSKMPQNKGSFHAPHTFTHPS